MTNTLHILYFVYKFVLPPPAFVLVLWAGWNEASSISIPRCCFYLGFDVYVSWMISGSSAFLNNYLEELLSKGYSIPYTHPMLITLYTLGAIITALVAPFFVVAFLFPSLINHLIEITVMSVIIFGLPFANFGIQSIRFMRDVDKYSH
jgi:hypothetical protein